MLLLFLQKKLFFILVVVQTDPFLCSAVLIGSQKKMFYRFYQIFFRTTGLQQRLLILTESPNMFYWKSTKTKKVGVVLGAKFGSKLGPMLWKNKETGITNWLFSYFAWGMHLKAKGSSYRNTWVEILKAKIAIKTKVPHFKKIRTKCLPAILILGQKWQKMIIFEVFIVSPKVTWLVII